MRLVGGETRSSRGGAADGGLVARRRSQWRDGQRGRAGGPGGEGVVGEDAGGGGGEVEFEADGGPHAEAHGAVQLAQRRVEHRVRPIAPPAACSSPPLPRCGVVI